MAYVLGLIFADGSILDVRKSSRTCYLHICSNDKSLLEQVRRVMSSNHRITSRKPRTVVFRGKPYFCKETFSLRIGNKIMYQDLIDKGLSPKKSLDMCFPFLPSRFFCFFLRGYFDGDGSISVYIPKDRKAHRVRIAFISGSYNFLYGLSNRIKRYLKTFSKTLYKGQYAYYLRYSKADSLRVLTYMYKDLESAPYLERKYDVFRGIP